MDSCREIIESIDAARNQIERRSSRIIGCIEYRTRPEHPEHPELLEVSKKDYKVQKAAKESQQAGVGEKMMQDDTPLDAGEQAIKLLSSAGDHLPSCLWSESCYRFRTTLRSARFAFYFV